MKTLIIGYGSIGKRHTDILCEMGIDVSVLSRRDIEFKESFTNITDALEKEPEYIVLASDTCDHYKDFQRLLSKNFTGKLLIEKPIFDKNIKVERPPFSVNVAYNLRFDPIIQKLKEEIKDKESISAHYYVGQHLASWRSSRNHLENYSAHKNKGGGVLRDLSHEFDIVKWLFGGIKSYTSIGGRYSDVTVDSEDVYAFVFKNEKCPIISMQMNYLDHVARREIIVNTTDISYKADLVNKTLWVNDKPLKMDFDTNHSYKKMHEDILYNNAANSCNLEEVLEIMSLIEEIES